MGKVILSCDIVAIVGEYGIQKTRERMVDSEGKPFGKVVTWYDVCIEQGNGDMVESFKTLKEARKWAKEN